MVRWSIMVVGLAVMLVGVLVGAAVVMWWRSPARVEYRADRRTLHRLRRRWRRLRRGASIADEARVRRLEHRLELGAQACRARRRNTGLVRWVRDWREPQPVRLEIPFERRYLLDACILLDELAAASEPTRADATDARDARPEAPAGGAVAEPA